MRVAVDYSSKFESFANRTLYEALDAGEREFLRRTAFEYRLTFQEFRQLAEASRDLAMWGEESLEAWWRVEWERRRPVGREAKARMLRGLREHLTTLKREPKRYSPHAAAPAGARERKPVVSETSDKEVFGMCPVASDKTVCCNLRTIDAVENCVFGCTYCAVQTFYQREIVFDKNFGEKLKRIPLDAKRFYHIGTGQASDSLAWGNREGILDDLCRFAADHPNALLELKTKSDNVRYFRSNPVPANVVCSWSLNTPTVIANEEHFTADLDRRLAAARGVADRGVKVAFHFHPMVFYHDWDVDYSRVAGMLLDRFAPQEVLFISFGSVTMTRPVVKKIRELGHATKILQMELVPDPHGKWTYPDETKIAMFRTMWHALRSWRDDVFMYLCMEKASIWERSFGFVYGSNDEFEQEFGRRTMAKLEPVRSRAMPHLS